jgi:hypothetical protein
VTTAGATLCWGIDDTAQLGFVGPDTCIDMGTTYPCARTPHPQSAGGIAHVALGQAHACSLGTDGVVRCWGRNLAGELGFPAKDSCGGIPCTTAPTPVTTASTIIQLAAAPNGGPFDDDGNCMIDVNGVASCWGFGPIWFSTELCAGSLCATSPQPVPTTKTVIQVSPGEDHACVLLKGGTIACWGENFTGQLGDGTLLDHASPAPISFLPSSAVDSKQPLELDQLGRRLAQARERGLERRRDRRLVRAWRASELLDETPELYLGRAHLRARGADLRPEHLVRYLHFGLSERRHRPEEWATSPPRSRGEIGGPPVTEAER